MPRHKGLIGMIDKHKPIFILGLLITFGAFFMQQTGILNDSSGTDSDTDHEYEPVELTPEEREAQNKAIKKIFLFIAFALLLISLAMLGVSPWFFWGLTAGLLIKR